MAATNTPPSARAAACPRAPTGVCSVCGQGGADPVERADLATIWLVPDHDGTPTERHYCRGCAPTGPVDLVACVRCGDGPLISGELTRMDLQVTAAIEASMAEHGWQLSGPACPTCRHDIAR